MALFVVPPASARLTRPLATAAGPSSSSLHAFAVTAGNDASAPAGRAGRLFQVRVVSLQELLAMRYTLPPLLDSSVQKRRSLAEATGAGSVPRSKRRKLWKELPAWVLTRSATSVPAFVPELDSETRASATGRKVTTGEGALTTTSAVRVRASSPAPLAARSVTEYVPCRA